MAKTDSKQSNNKKVVNAILNFSILALFLVCGYLVFSIVSKSVSSKNRKPVEITDTTDKVTNQPNLTMQLDVRNGTGEDGIAKMFTDYLREKGFDVVEMGNYNTEDQEKSLVLDRKGNKQNCKKIASALGLSEKNVIEQINKELLIDATVVIGKDYKELAPYLSKKPN